MENLEKQKNINSLAIYLIQEAVEGQKPSWIYVGAAYLNRDKSLNLRFKQPIGAGDKLQIRPFQKKEEQR